MEVESLSADIPSTNAQNKSNMIRERANKKIFLNKQYVRLNELFEPFMYIKH